MQKKAQTFRKPYRAIKFLNASHKNKRVVTFLGFSNAGYENEEEVETSIISILKNYSPTEIIVNAGATEVGIGKVYDIAKKLGFTTTGIVSTQAKKHNAGISKNVDQVLYIQDKSWGGFLEDWKNSVGKEKVLSPTSEVMVATSDIIYAIGGGTISRDEIIEARESGKEVHFIAADKNHQIAIDKSRRKNEPIPRDFRGELAEYWTEL
jgi:NADPH:quinone reductase-like Zn-dependent oxidoreductase